MMNFFDVVKTKYLGAGDLRVSSTRPQFGKVRRETTQ